MATRSLWSEDQGKSPKMEPYHQKELPDGLFLREIGLVHVQKAKVYGSNAS